MGWNADSQTLERSLALAQKAIALDDSLPTAHSLLSTNYALKQQYDQATVEWERAIALDSNNADSHAWQAEALLFAGRSEDALRAVEQAMRLNSRYPFWYLVNLGWAYFQTGRYAEAITTLKEASSRSPNHIPAHSFLASTYLWQWVSQQSPDTQTLEPALVAVQRALALNDSLHWSHINLGYICLYQHQYEQALAEMERAVGTCGFGPNTGLYGPIGGRPGAAAQALRLKPAAVDIHLSGVGTAYAVAGHYEEARAPLQRFLSRFPNWLPFRLMLAAVYSELGQAAEARAEAAEVLRLNPQFSLEVYKQRMPIRDPVMLERHIAALRKAGLK